MDLNSKIFVAGHKGLFGSSLVRRLKFHGYSNILTADRSELDLFDQKATYNFLRTHKPDYIFIAAAKVGGIEANNIYKADFLIENLTIQNNLIYGAFKNDINKLCFLGSSCIYPKYSKQPIKEEYLLNGELEKTNEPYAIAKIAGLKLCESLNYQYGTEYLSVMPTNLYGPNDKYDLNISHVIPALIIKTFMAKKNNDPFLEVWGSGKPRREFLFIDDASDACILLMEKNKYDGPYNIGYGEDLTILDLINKIKACIGYEGQIKLNPKKPDGMMKKLLDSSRIKSLGWSPKLNIDEGLKQTIDNYLENL